MDLSEIFDQEIAAKITEIAKEKGINVIVDNKENPAFIPRARLNEVSSKVNNYKEQLEQALKQNEEIKKHVNSEELTNKINELKTKFEETEQKLHDTKINNLIKDYARSQKAKDLDVLTMLVDKSKLTIQDDKIYGLDEQISTIKSQKSYLFDSQEVEATAPAPQSKKIGATNPIGHASIKMSLQEQLKDAQAKGNTRMSIKLKQRIHNENKK